MITATQMLESMVHEAEPTRAEASDVANAVLDGSSALMLSQETAVGEYPVEAVAMMDQIARTIEPSLGYRHELPEASEEPTVGQALSNAACDIAEALRARAIVVPTFSGRTASAVARLRPRRPIAAITHRDAAAQQMALEWGVVPLVIPEATDVDDLWTRSVAAAREAGVVDAGDRVVIAAGTHVNVAGSTNVIRVDVADRPCGKRRSGPRRETLRAMPARSRPRSAARRRSRLWIAVVAGALPRSRSSTTGR